MRKTKFQLKHKRERIHRRPIDKENYANFTKNFKHSHPKQFPKEDSIEIDDKVYKFRVNKLGQVCQINSHDPYIIAKLQGRPYYSIY